MNDDIELAIKVIDHYVKNYNLDYKDGKMDDEEYYYRLNSLSVVREHLLAILEEENAQTKM